MTDQNPPLDKQWEEFADALQSSDSDQVNDVIDDIKDMDLNERMVLFNICFDDLVGIYREHDDGYVRQAVVRVTEQLVPGIPAVVALDAEEPSLNADADDVRTQTDTLCGFLLETMTDDDGRVRQSAIRALQDVFRTYDSLEDEETIHALAQELERMAADASGPKREHLLEVKEHATHTLQSSLGRIVRDFQAEHDEFL